MGVYDNIYSFDDIKEYMMKDALGLPIDNINDYDFKYEIKGEVFANVLIDLLKHLK